MSKVRRAAASRRSLVYRFARVVMLLAAGIGPAPPPPPPPEPPRIELALDAESGENED